MSMLMTKYLYWAPSSFGKCHACMTFASNNKVAMKYGIYQGTFEISSGTVIEPEYTYHGFNGKVQVEALYVKKGSDLYSSKCTRTNFLAGDPDRRWLPYNQNNVMTREQVEEHHRRHRTKDLVPECPFPEHTLRDDKTWLDNLKSAVDDFDPSIICLEEPLPISVNIDYKDYTSVVPYKSENFKKLIFDYLTLYNVDGKSTLDIFNHLDGRLVLVERQLEYLELQGIKWEWLDISKWENYKYFGLDNIPNHDMKDHDWFSPEIRNKRIDYYSMIAERYVEGRKGRLNTLYPLVKN